MAIIDNLGLEVKVFVNGVQTAEYPDDEPDGQGDAFGAETASCHRYVESVDNAEFAIEVSTTAANPWFDNDKKAISFRVDIDGKEDVDVSPISKAKVRRQMQGVKDRNSNPVTLRRFRFSPVCVVEDTSHARTDADMKCAEQLGLIRVRAYRTTKRTESRTNGKTKEAVVREFSEGKSSLAAKALKGRVLSHATVLSPAVTTHRSKLLNYDYEDPTDKPLAVFYFKYRSKAALQKELIIPDPRALSPPSSDRGSIPRSEIPGSADELLDGLALAEVRRLAQQRLSDGRGDLSSLSLTEVRRLAGEALDSLPLREVRRLTQQSPSANGQAEKVKREPDGASASDRPFKYVKVEGGKEAIDLTDD